MRDANDKEKKEAADRTISPYSSNSKQNETSQSFKKSGFFFDSPSTFHLMELQTGPSVQEKPN